MKVLLKTIKITSDSMSIRIAFFNLCSLKELKLVLNHH